MRLPLVILWTSLAVCILPAGLATRGAAQSVAPDWQPYRDGAGGELQTAVGLGSTGGDTVGASAGDGTTAAQYQAGVCQPMPCPGAPCEGTVVFPQPVCVAPMAPTPYFIDQSAAPPTSPEYWQWRVLPEGVIWQSYMAGEHEPRISGMWFGDGKGNALWDIALGGRASILRYGTDGPGRPQGLELQMEGAAFPRLNLDHERDLDAVDFRFGLPIVYGRDQWQFKFSYYHLSSHMGDELAIRERNMGVDALSQRINFVRETLVAGVSYFPLPAWRWYAEAGWAFHADGGSEPWEFQFGVDVAEPGPTGLAGTPFIAVNGHLRQELNFGGNVVFQAGWLWRGETTRTLRVGFDYFNGKSNQFEFFNHFEQQIGGGIWMDY